MELRHIAFLLLAAILAKGAPISKRDQGTQCSNVYPECPEWKRNGMCEQNHDYMTATCPITCGFCNELTGVPDDDQNSEGSGFAEEIEEESGSTPQVISGDKKSKEEADDNKAKQSEDDEKEDEKKFGEKATEQERTENAEKYEDEDKQGEQGAKPVQQRSHDKKKNLMEKILDNGELQAVAVTKGKARQKTSGVAMGSKLGPSYACLFVGHQEQLIFQSYNGPFPCLVKRYIDDIVGATSLPLADLQKFINYTNNFHPALQFTHSITEESLPFLDILLSISDDQISTSIFYKATDSHCLLNYESSHPKKCKDSIPYSQLRRLRRICSNDDDFSSKAEEMSSFFKQNKYPDHITQAAFNKVKDLSQDEALQPSNNENSNNRIPFTLTYHPFNNNVKNIIYNNFNILTNDTETKNIFIAPPLMAFRRDKNLKDSLVKTNLATSQLPGTFPCQHRLCQTCTHINQSTTITNQNRSFNIRSNFTCSSSCVIYCIICTKCQYFYIGETSRQINNRFGEHKRNVRNKIHLDENHENDPDSNISKHYNSANHSTADMSILGLLYAPQDTTKRKTLEKRLIFNLKTLYPNGLNKQFTYLQ